MPLTSSVECTFYFHIPAQLRTSHLLEHPLFIYIWLFFRTIGLFSPNIYLQICYM